MRASSRPRHPRAALALAAATVATAAPAAALLSAAPASAASIGVDATYRATFTATIAYDHDRATADGANVSSEHASFAIRLRADVAFVDGLLLRPVVISNLTVSDARSSRSETAEDVAKRCGGTSVLSTAPASLLPTRAFRPAAAPTEITLVPFVSADLFMSCTDKQGSVFDESIQLGNLPLGGGRAGGGPFDVAFSLPREQVGREQIVVTPPSQARANGVDCPSREVDTRTCIAAVRSPRLVLDLIESDEDELIAPLGPIAPKVTKGARRAQTRATCPAGCRVRIRVFLPRGRLGRASAVAAAAARPLAQRSLTLRPSSRPQLVALPLGAAARAAAKRAGALRLELTLDPPAGRTVTRSALAPLAR